MADRMTVLLLPGQGAQREQMAAGLYGRQPGFTACVTGLLAALGDEGDQLAAEWLRAAPNPAMGDAAVAQPLLLIVGYALGAAMTAAGHAPDVLVGHSVGELAAACLAGVFSPADLAPLVAARSRSLGAEGRGGMLVAAASPDDVRGELAPGVTVAAVNGPRQCVLAGPSEALKATEASLRSAGFTVRALKSGHAFHSPIMRGTAARFRTELSKFRLNAPGTTLISSRTAAPVSPAQATDPAFWADQLALPVRYWAALKSLLDSSGTCPGLVLLDGSADRSLTAGARRHPAIQSGSSLVVPLIGPSRTTGSPADAVAWAAALESLASLAGAGPTVRGGQAEQVGSCPPLYATISPKMPTTSSSAPSDSPRSSE
jgi:acyl transferase domain-containing protein